MPRIYNIVRPSANKAVAPGQEKKGETSALPKNKDNKDKGGGK